MRETDFCLSHLGYISQSPLNATASGNLGGHSDNKVAVWDYANGVKIFEADVDTNMVSSVAFSSDGRLLASAAYDGVVRLWAVQQ